MKLKQIEDKMSKLQNWLEGTNIETFEIIDYCDFKLTIAGAFDIGVCHDLEIILLEVGFMQCESLFSAKVIRIATEKERKNLLKTKFIKAYEDDDVVFVFEDSKKSISKNYIVAEDIDYNFDTVYRYKRDNLQQGERIAYWIGEDD